MGQNGQTDKRNFQPTNDFEKIENLKNPLNRRVKEQLENLKTDVTQKSFYEIKTDDNGNEYIEYKTTTIINYLNQIKDKVKNLSGIRNLNNSAAYIMCIQIGLEACGYDVGQIDGVLSNKGGTEKSQTENAIIQLKRYLRKTDPSIRINGIPDSSIIPYLIDGLEQHDSSEQHNDSSEQHNDSSEQHNDSSEQHNDSSEQHNDSSEQHNDSSEQHNDSSEQHNDSSEQHNDSSEQHNDSSEQHNNSSEQHNDSSEQHNDSSEQHNDSPEQHNDSPEQQDIGSELDELKFKIIKPKDVTSADIGDIPDINENRVEINQNQSIEVKNTLDLLKQIQNDTEFKKFSPENLGYRENGEFKFNKTYSEIPDKLKYECIKGEGYVDFYLKGGNNTSTSYHGIRCFENGDTCTGSFDKTKTKTGEDKYMIKAGFKKGFYTKIIDNNIKLTCYNDNSITLTIPQGEIQNFMNDLREYRIQPQTADFTLDGNIIKKIIGRDKMNVINVDFSKKYGLSNEEYINIVNFLNIKT